MVDAHAPALQKIATHWQFLRVTPRHSSSRPKVGYPDCDESGLSGLTRTFTVGSILDLTVIVLVSLSVALGERVSSVCPETSARQLG